MSDGGGGSVSTGQGAAEPRGHLTGAPLLAALARLSSTLQPPRTTRGELLRIAGEGLAPLGLHLALLKVDGPLLVLEFIFPRDALIDEVERLLRQPVEGTACPLELAPLSLQVLKQRQFAYSDQVLEGAVRFLTNFPGNDGLQEVLSRSAFQRGVVAPVYARGEPYGVLVVCADWLTEDDVPAVGLFGMQLSSALSVAEANAALAHRGRELAAIHSVATAGSEAELERLLPKLLRIAAQSTQSDRAAIFLLRGERPELSLAAAHGLKQPLEERHARLSQGTAIEDVARTLVPRALNVRQWPVRARADLRADGIEETALLPLHVQLRPAGCVLLGRSDARPYTDEDLAFGKLLAEQIAIQVENARLYAKAQRKVEHLSLLFSVARLGTEAREVTPLIQGVIGQAVDAFAVDGALVYLREGDRLVLTGHQLEQPLGPADLAKIQDFALDETTMVGKAAVRKRAVSSARDGLSELAARLGIRFAATAPLVAKDQVVGTFMVIRRSSRPFAEDELLLFESCAAHLGVAIEQVRLFEAERQRVRDLSVINELGGIIAQRLDLPSVLRSGVAHLQRLTDIPNIFLLLLDPSGQNLRMEASSIPDPSVLEVSIPLSEPAAATAAFHAMRPVVMDDAYQDPRASKPLARRYHNRALMAVPLISDGRAIGSMVLGETRPGVSFPPEAVERALAISNQVATAIAGARHYEELKRSYDDLHRAQEELVRRERLAAVGELAALVAHEVRNPLAVIFNSLSSLRRVLKPEGNVKVLLGIVDEEADRLNRMVGDFLDFARPNEPMMQPELLEQVISDAVEGARSVQDGTVVEVRLDIPRPLSQIPCDARLLRQAIINLVVNAIQAMPKGGEVTVRATEERWEGQPYIRVDVSDTGPGIPPNVSERLFEPFFTTKASGTGLGLAVVKRIVEAHHGDIEVRTAQGEGTTFTVRIPISLAESGPSSDLATP